MLILAQRPLAALSLSKDASTSKANQRRQRALAVVSYWTPDEWAERQAREWALRKVLSALAAFPIRVRTVLVTNKYVPQVADLVSQQEVRPEPFCGPPQINVNYYCLPWEAIRVLARGRMHQACGNGFRVPGTPSNCSTAGNYDFYFYIEGDILVPPSSFEFWQKHVDRLHRRGYLLQAHRRERRRERSQSWEVLPDCHMPSCRGESSVLFDKSPYTPVTKGICAGTHSHFNATKLGVSHPNFEWHTIEGLATGARGTSSMDDCYNLCASVSGCQYFSGCQRWPS